MKAFFTKKLFILTMLFLSFGTVKAQMLELIENPDGFPLNFFSGGEEGNLFFEYFDPNTFNSLMYHYDQVDLSAVPLPPENQFSFFSHEFNGNWYFVSFDIAFNAELWEYNGSDATELPIPTGFQFNNYVGQLGDKMLVSLFDNATFDNALYEYDGTDLVEVPSPTGFAFNNTLGELNGKLYLSFFDETNFSVSIFSYDGNVIDVVGGAPENANFMFSPYQNEERLFILVQDASFITTFFDFDGTDFIEVVSPPNQQFSFVVGENEDVGEWYINYFDNITFQSTLYIYNGSDLTEITGPPGFDFPNLANISNGTTYIAMFDNITFEGALFKLGGSVLEPIAAPAGFSYNQYAGTIDGDNYYIYFDAGFNNTLMKLEAGADEVTAVANPIGFNLGFFLGSTESKILLSFNDATFSPVLFLFDGENFTEIENPVNEQLGWLMTEDQGAFYLRYDNINTFNGTLYKLVPNSFPTSIDTFVTTEMNMPYFFNADDFFFADNDQNDELVEILITEIEQVGFLLWNGAHVYEGDIIPYEDLDALTFTPLQDELGNPYDAFRFKVGDGEAFSELDYIMQINVIDPSTSTDDNELNQFAKVFPNPANNYTNLQLNSDLSIDYLELRVFDAQGQVVWQNRFDNPGQSFNESINVSDLSPGAYYIVGYSPQGKLVKPLQVIR